MLESPLVERNGRAPSVDLNGRVAIRCIDLLEIKDIAGVNGEVHACLFFSHNWMYDSDTKTLGGRTGTTERS